jgi:hypothetical protein
LLNLKTHTHTQTLTTSNEDPSGRNVRVIAGIVQVPQLVPFPGKISANGIVICETAFFKNASQMQESQTRSQMLGFVAVGKLV